MLYRAFGQTGVEVSALGFGGMRFERPDETEAMAEVVYHAFERGVTYFDTAPGYFAGKSETIVGVAAKEMRKTGKPFYIATKTMARDARGVRKQLEESMKRLNVDAVDFYHVWCLVQPDDLPNRKTNGVLEEFRKLKEEGLIRHVCVSTHLEYERVGEMLDQGDGLFEGMLIGLSAINCDLRYPGVQEAGKRGMGVVTMNTLSGGLIPDNAGHFEFIQHSGDRSVVEAAIRFNLSLPEVTVALVGCRNIADVDEAADAVDRFSPLTAEEVEAARARLATEAKDLCTQCGYCRDCPVGIPVVRIMGAYNMRMLNNPQAAFGMLKWHWGIPDLRAALEACTGCGQCEAACTQHLPILERFDQLREDQDEVEI